MGNLPGFIKSRLPLLAVALVSAVSVSACAARVRYYDGYHQDYHTWNGTERDYYIRWERETHHDHVEWERRNAEDQRAYWGWRHDH